MEMFILGKTLNANALALLHFAIQHESILPRSQKHLEYGRAHEEIKYYS